MLPPLSFSRRLRLSAVAIASVPVLLLASCGDDTDTVVADEPASADAATGGDGAKDEVLIEIEERGEPEVEVPDAPATEIEVTDLEVGTGEEVGPGATITAHYTGVAQGSGETFDSSWKRDEAATFPLSQVIPGWSEGLVGMKVGGRRELVIPGELAYGDQPPSDDIKPGETLVFVVDLVSIDDAGPKVDVEALAATEERGEPKIKVPDPLPTELEIIDEVDGDGAEVKAGDQVTVSYVGVSASTGETFDSSWDRNQPATFTLDQVIPGWGEGLVGMKVGGRRELIIPPDKAYGDQPPSDDIKPGETLVFVVDLVGIG